MKQLVTQGIILSRTDYGEADRIITLLTPDYGKLRLMARGVRRVKSKLAGGIELFSVSHLTFIRGKGEIGTLVSTRLVRHYGHIIQDITRVQLGYELIKLLNKITEDEPEPEYFALMEQAFAALDEAEVPTELVAVWFDAQLLRQGGFTPNLTTDSAGQRLQPDHRFAFHFDASSFAEDPDGPFTADHIKFLRLLFSGNQPKTLHQVQGSLDLLPVCAPLIRSLRQEHLRV